MINLGQKGLLIDAQGNWGDVRTGDRAAASRYIEARLSKFALEVAFNPQTTEWQRSYDGRKNEPVFLPMKFPMGLAQGAEGIAVGLATKIMPHNFIELIDASIDVLHNKPINLIPDFPNGGMADFSNYNEGLRGGKIRLRAHIEVRDKKTLAITDVPYGTTTTTLMDSIVKANDNNKIKIKKVTDNTAQKVEIIVDLPANVSPDITIDALYAFTNCEVSISPNACVIIDDKPRFIGVNEILTISTANTLQLLKRELEIKLHELSEKLFFSSLEKIFIENRIYRDIEECETWEAVLIAIDQGLDPFKKLLLRDVTEDDIIRLTEIKIKRISKYDSFKADEIINRLDDEIAKVKHNLANLIEFAVAYFVSLKEKYGKDKKRKTEIRSFDNIQISQVAVANQKLYINRKEGFVGYGLKKDELISECSDIDDIIVFLKSGKFIVTRISEKSFVGKDIIYAAVWRKGDERMVYNMIYYDSKADRNYAKRFAVTSITRDKAYDLTKGGKNSKVLYFTANPNSESEIVSVYLNPVSRARNKIFDFDFAELSIKGRGAGGNIISRYPIRKITQKTVGSSTLGKVPIWYDDTVGRLNTDERGQLLGKFDNGDLILSVYKDGSYELTTYELTNHYNSNNLLFIEQFDDNKIITAVHYDGEQKNFYIKRFKIESTQVGKRYTFISESKSSNLILVTSSANPVAELEYLKGKPKQKYTEKLILNDLVDVKGWKARGNRLSKYEVVFIDFVEQEEPPEIVEENSSEKAQEKSQKEKDEKKLGGQATLFD
jgi:topoisomerase-4 subunit A